MDETSYRILVVDDDLDHLALMEQSLFLMGNVTVDVAKNPEEAIDLIEAKGTSYPVIWSDYNFNDSKFNGLDFLEEVTDLSPLSARLLSSEEKSPNEMNRFVERDLIHSFVSKPIDFECLYSATNIGIEYHKINVFGVFLDVSIAITNYDFESMFGAMGQVEDIKCEGRGLELSKLSIHSDSILNRIPATILRTNALGEDDGTLGVIKYFLKRSDYLTEYLDQTQLSIDDCFEKVRNTLIETDRNDELIKRLKGEFKP
ncbi:MAG: CheY-like chemotaxis protein [Nitrospinales bacterium]|jgi:CheY-like chemotaxis protein